uniref:Transmembrane protein n=1 Tax=Parascaris univalens TaxID=6257 RepID=A0A915BWH5_PARUN
MFLVSSSNVIVNGLETSTRVAPVTSPIPYPTASYIGPYTGEYLGHIWRPKTTPSPVTSTALPATTESADVNVSSNETKYAKENSTHEVLTIYKDFNASLVKKLVITTAVASAIGVFVMLICTPWCDRKARDAHLTLDIYTYEEMIRNEKLSIKKAIRAREIIKREEMLQSPERLKKLELRRRYGLKQILNTSESSQCTPHEANQR